MYLTTELLRRDNIRSYRYKIINWGLVLLRAGVLCTSGLFILGLHEKSPFLAPQVTKGYILLLESRYRDSDIGGMAREVLRVIKGGVFLRDNLQETPGIALSRLLTNNC